MKTVSLEQFKKDMKELGCKVRTVTHADFKHMSVLKNDLKLNAGNVFDKDFLDEHKDFFNYKNNTKIEKTGGWPIVF